MMTHVILTVTTNVYLQRCTNSAASSETNVFIHGLKCFATPAQCTETEHLVFEWPEWKLHRSIASVVFHNARCHFLSWLIYADHSAFLQSVVYAVLVCLANGCILCVARLVDHCIFTDTEKLTNYPLFLP